jgi:hypothetical protein
MFFVVVEVLYYKIDDKSVSFIVVKPCDEVYLVCVANLTLLLLQVATTIERLQCLPLGRQLHIFLSPTSSLLC